MFKRTRYNKGPSFLTELSKEFSERLNPVKLRINLFLRRYPKSILMVMCILMSASAISRFAFSQSDGSKISAKANYRAIGNEFSSGLQAGNALVNLLDLQNQINVILHKDTLSADDSVHIQNALKRIETIQRTIKPTNHDSKH